MKAGILAMALLLVVGVFGQTTTKKEAPKKSSDERAHAMTERMTKSLELNEEQKAKIYEINLGIAQKNDAIRTDASLSKEEKVKRIQENHAARNAMYREVLTPDQYAKYEAWEKEKKAKMAEKREMKKAEKTTQEKKETKKAPAPPAEEVEEEL